jgi:hypothetical protein
MRKEDKFVEEREGMLIKVLKAIGINKGRTIIERSELEREEIRSKMNEMKEEIWRYYRTSSWNSCKYGKCQELNIIKNICKYHGITIYKVEKKRKDGDKIRSYKVYDFNINEEIKERLI